MMQIQPEYCKCEEYLSFALEKGLEFEVLELSMFPRNGEEIKEWYKNTGLVKSLHGAFIDMNPVSNDEAIASVSRERYEESCKIAVLLGAENVVFHSTCYPFLRGKYLESWAQKSAEYHISLAEKYGLNIFIENSFDVDTTPLAELMKRANDRRVRVCLDIGHANYSRVPVEQWFYDLGEYIGYLHLSDNVGCFDEHMALGTGTIDFFRVSELCKSLEKNTPMTLEVGGINSIKKSVEFMQNNRLFGM